MFRQRREIELGPARGEITPFDQEPRPLPGRGWLLSPFEYSTRDERFLVKLHINVIPDLDDDEFADELLVGFTLRRPRPIDFALPKIEFIPASGVEAYEKWLRERMVPTPVLDDAGDPVVGDDGQSKTTPREPISDKELMLKQVEVALMALARDHKAIISVAKARQVVERLDAGSVGQVRWVYDRWKEASEASLGESGASTGSSAGSSGGPSDTTSSPVDSIPAA